MGSRHHHGPEKQAKEILRLASEIQSKVRYGYFKLEIRGRSMRACVFDFVVLFSIWINDLSSLARAVANFFGPLYQTRSSKLLCALVHLCKSTYLWFSIFSNGVEIPHTFFGVYVVNC